MKNKEILTIKEDKKSVYEIRIQYKYYYDVFKYITIKSLKQQLIWIATKLFYILYFRNKPITVLRQFTEKIAKGVYHESN
jgi:hypothetical protein